MHTFSQHPSRCFDDRLLWTTIDPMSPVRTLVPGRIVEVLQASLPELRRVMRC